LQLTFMLYLQIKRAGHWETASIKISYLSRMPAKFIRRMAGFQKEEGSYVLPRAGYEPPVSLQRQIWLWLEGWLARVQAHVQGKGWKAGGLA
jgi:Centromere DNA-binding protein complex CBF3 subunit, domain 2